VRTFVKSIYDRHVAGLRGVTAGGTWIDDGAARLSLWLALDELDAHHLQIDPQTNGNLARMQQMELRLLTWLDAHAFKADESDYAFDPAGAVLEILDQQRSVILMQSEAIIAQKAEIERLRTVPTLHINGSDTGSYTPSAVELVSWETAIATEPPAPAAVDDDFRQRCIAEMRRLANNGTTCTQQEWNELRQDLPDFAEMLDTLRMSWRDLVAAAGLRGASGRRILKERTDAAATTSARRGNASTAMAELIDEHKANGAEPVDDSERYANHLDAYDTRFTVRQGKTPDGEPVQVVSTHYMLR
jgi:hypothetical protein